MADDKDKKSQNGGNTPQASGQKHMPQPAPQPAARPTRNEASAGSKQSTAPGKAGAAQHPGKKHNQQQSKPGGKQGSKHGTSAAGKGKSPTQSSQAKSGAKAAPGKSGKGSGKSGGSSFGRLARMAMMSGGGGGRGGSGGGGARPGRRGGGGGGGGGGSGGSKGAAAKLKEQQKALEEQKEQSQKERDSLMRKRDDDEQFAFVMNTLLITSNLYQQQAETFKAQEQAVGMAIDNVENGRDPTYGMTAEQKQHFEEAIKEYKDKYGLTDIDLKDITTLRSIQDLAKQNKEYALSEAQKARDLSQEGNNADTLEKQQAFLQNPALKDYDTSDEITAHMADNKAVVQKVDEARNFDKSEQDEAIAGLDQSTLFIGGAFGQAASIEPYEPHPTAIRQSVPTSFTKTMKGHAPLSDKALTGNFNGLAADLKPEVKPIVVPKPDIELNQQMAAQPIPEGPRMG